MLDLVPPFVFLFYTINPDYPSVYIKEYLVTRIYDHIPNHSFHVFLLLIYLKIHAAYYQPIDLFFVVRMLSILKLAKKGKRLSSLKLHCYCQLTSTFSEHTSTVTPVGHLPVYVGEGRHRFLIPVSFLSHPLFSMLLERAYKEFGFEQSTGLILPCDASIFQEVVSAVKCSHGQFNLEKFVGDLI